MYDDIIAQLSNANPQRREAALKALARTKDPQVLPILKQHAGREDDPRLRALAVNAGRYIRKHAGTSSASAAAADTPKAKHTPVSSDDPIELLEAAVRASDAHEARRLVNEALSIDPSLERDPTYDNFIRNVTLGGDDVEPGAARKSKSPQIKKSSKQYEASFSKALLALFVMLLCIYATNVGVSVVLPMFLETELAQLAQITEGSGDYALAASINALQSVVISDVLVNNLIDMAAYAVQFLLVMLAMHLTSTYFFNSGGIFSTLLERASWFSAVVIPLNILVLSAGLVFVLETDFAEIVASTSGLNARVDLFYAEFWNMARVMLGIFAACYAVWCIGITMILGSTYQTDFLGGFLTFVLGQILLFYTTYQFLRLVNNASIIGGVVTDGF